MIETTRRTTDVASILRAELAAVQRQMWAIQADARARLLRLAVGDEAHLVP